MSIVKDNIHSDISNNIYLDDTSFFSEFILFDNVTDNIKGLKTGVVTSIKDNFNVEVFINELNITVLAPLFYVNSISVNVGDTILVYVESLFSFKALALHSKTGDYITDERGVVKLSTKNSELVVDEAGITMSFGDKATTYKFKQGGVNVSSEDSLNVTIGNNVFIYFRDMMFQGNMFDVMTGSITSFLKPTLLLNNGISLRSFFGNVDITSTLGNTNISSGTFTNVGSLVMTNIVSTGLVNITAPLIPNLTIGFFSPLLPSPAGIVAYKDLLQNLASPLKAPLPTFGDDIMKKVRQFLPI